jgi:hypothetical protein
MAKSERHGYLVVNGGVNPTLAQVGKLVALSMDEIEPLISELMKAGVCSIEEGTGIVFSRRMVRDRADYEKASEYGRKGGNPRLTRVKGRVKAQGKGSPQPSLASSVLPLASSISVESEAMKIYQAYPRRTQRANALRAIDAALAKKPFDQLIEATKAYAVAVSTWPADRRRFVPHPASWFNSEGYEDDRETWAYVAPATTVSWQRPATTAEEHAKGF